MMASGGDRIIANLPATFAAIPRPTVLATLIDAFGGELAGAENSLSAMMFAHWVDFADKDSTTLSDLPAIAALYGLAARDDETIEGFRAHLKRYVRTFIDGTVTVRGIFRITAEALGLVIADNDTELDTWWNRKPGASLTTVEPAGDDAATALFGVASVAVRGTAPQAAGFVGSVDLSQSVDLRGRSLLALGVDGAAPVTFDLAPHLPDPAAADVGAIVAALADAPGIVATVQDGHLAIRSASFGAASSLEFGELAGDAAATILGIAPHEYAGVAARRAQIVGTVDLPATIDMSSRRYLRLTIDAAASYEIDCAGANPSATTQAEVLAAIQAEAGPGVASLWGLRLVLASPTLGLAGTIAVRAPTTGDATTLLLGDAKPYARGSDAAPARVSGLVDLSGGIDLSTRANLMVAFDPIAPVVINCAGPRPEKTLAGDIAAAINAAVGLPVASQNGATVTLTSQVVGPASRIRCLTAPSGDALDLIFGFGSRRATGADATAARFTGSADLTHGVDLRAVQRVQLAVDDGAPATVDFSAAGLVNANVAPADLVAAINAQLGAAVASTGGSHLTLSSGATGDQGSVAILPIETTVTRRFVSRAFPTDEASNTVLGVFAAEAQGGGASHGALAGAIDLNDGLDLRIARYLRLATDGGPPRDVDCASQSPRPRAVLLQQVVDAINLAFGLHDFASIATGRLVLTSPATGSASAVKVIGGAGDASAAIFGGSSTVVSGSAAQRLVFTGLVDLSQRIDLSAADRVKLAIDGRPALEIQCAGGDPSHTSAAEIAGLINAALGGSYASTDGRYLRLASAIAGSAGEIGFLAPSQRDATRPIFGVSPERTYHGDDATAASLISAHDLPPTLDLSASPFVRLTVDGGASVLIDCGGADSKRTTPTEIAARIVVAFPSPAPLIAGVRGARIVLTSKSAGTTSRIALQSAGDHDAGATLLGNATATAGTDASPATLIGTVDLRTGVDLSQRSVLRLAIDGGRAIDVDLSGAAPDRTFGDEITAALNAAVPGIADINPNGQLVLASPTRGEASRIAVLPLRPLEMVEYPPRSATSSLLTLHNGDRFSIVNDGAAASVVSFALSSAGGFCGIDLIGLTSSYRIHVGASVDSGNTLMIAAANDGRIAASLTDTQGMTTPAAVDQAFAMPIALGVLVPFTGSRPLAAGEPGSRHALALVDPLAGNVVLLEALAGASPAPAEIRVSEASVTESSGPPSAPDGRLELLGRLHAQGNRGELRDGADAPIARVRAKAGVTFAPFDGRMVAARGDWYPSGPTPLLAVDTLACVFDVQIDATSYEAVAIDARTGVRSLTSRLAGAGGSGVIARDKEQTSALRLPRGRSDWLVSWCDESRFDAANFESAHFAGGRCDVAGIFDVSRFNSSSDESQPGSAVVDEQARFAPLPDDSTLTVTATWQSHQTGAFTVNLPADLPDQFGARFNAGRFASQDETSETYAGVVFEPPHDERYLPTVLPVSEAGSPLVFAKAVPVVPLGWEPQKVPFAQPRTRYLSGGRANAPSAIYLQEPGVPGAIGIVAKENGAWGDEIAVTVRFAGPAMFDVTVAYPGARFESARAIVLAGRILTQGEDPLPARVAQIIKPGPIGAVQAKAAGIAASVTRDRT